jgi:hypothetical protein
VFRLLLGQYLVPPLVLCRVLPGHVLSCPVLFCLCLCVFLLSCAKGMPRTNRVFRKNVAVNVLFFFLTINIHRYNAMKSRLRLMEGIVLFWSCLPKKYMLVLTRRDTLIFIANLFHVDAARLNDINTLVKTKNPVRFLWGNPERY